MGDANDQDQPQKIVLIGMENAGKTTIVNLLEQKGTESPHNPPNMIPTRGVKKSSLFQDTVMAWDFGGQETYRNQFLADPEKHFQKISFLYYVVDIQDYYRLMNSAMYFMGVFNLIRKYSPAAKIVFLFHKTDPGFDVNQKNLKEKFLGFVESFIKANDRTFIMYDTTIFDLNSINTAFSQLL
jgi:GTPase SAR1 family protein